MAKSAAGIVPRHGLCRETVAERSFGRFFNFDGYRSGKGLRKRVMAGYLRRRE